jgi:hypothetical protein
MNNMHCLSLDFLTWKLYKCLLQIILAYIEVAHEDKEDFKTLLNFQMGYGTSLYESVVLTLDRAMSMRVTFGILKLVM